MRIADIDDIECTNGKNWGVSIFTQGCPYYCKGCHNAEIWDFDGGKLYTRETQEKILKLTEQPFVKRLSILGGEPLLPANVQEIEELIDAAKATKPNIEIWLWTGAAYKDLLNLSVKKFDLVNDKVLLSLGWNDNDLAHLQHILKKIDYLIDGRFVEEQKDLSLAFRGSANQNIISMQ